VIAYLKFRRKVYQLEQELRAEEKASKIKIDKATKRGATADEIYELKNDYAGAYFHFTDEIKAAHGSYVLAQARRLIVEVPSLKNKRYWEGNDQTYTLTEEGVRYLRNAVRAERKARVELVVMWLPGVVGLVGTLIGLAAVLTGRK
jgi:hypothetical protein